AANTTLDLIVFMSYSGQWDILQAARKMALEILEKSDSLEAAKTALQAATPQDFHDCLVTAGVPDPDLIVRTSGESRISNYLLWQSAYSEWVFTDILWPDFRRDAFLSVLEIYAKRDRRYGKLK
ncbi:MAG: undecaprenyl diphosphate synthase family protein, partial [Bacteroidales bacterium]|nr:undecaprenyl diphosphate synthase family protein [Bacteroidales bacterium]